MHTTSEVRDALQDYLDNGHFNDGDEALTLNEVVGSLWDCTDILPAGYCEQLDLPQGSTYSQAVRHMRKARKKELVNGKLVSVPMFPEINSDSLKLYSHLIHADVGLTSPEEQVDAYLRALLVAANIKTSDAYRVISSVLAVYQKGGAA